MSNSFQQNLKSSFWALLCFFSQAIVAQTPDTTEQKALHEVVVTGNFPVYLQALQTQRQAAGVVSVLNLDLPGRFPDLNPAEALQRLPGVVVQRSEGEGRYIHIRGADPALTTVQMNGDQIISPESKNRFLQFDLLPIDHIRAVEVNKTNMPDQDGDAIGGSVNLLTKHVRNDAAVWQASVAGGFNPAAGLPNGQAQVSYSGHNLLLNGSIWQDHRSSDNLETLYGERDFGSGDLLYINSLELKQTAVARRRMGLSGEYVVPFRQTSGKAYLRGTYADFLEVKLRQRMRYRPEKGVISGIADTIFGARIGRDIEYKQEAEHFASAQAGFEKTWERWKFDGTAAYSYGVESEPTGQSLDFQLHDVNLLRIDNNNQFPQFVIVNDRAASEYGAYTLHEYEEEDDYSTDQSVAAKLNAQLRLKKATDYLQFGIKGRSRHKATRSTERIFDEYTGGVAPALTDLLDNGQDHTLFNQRYVFGRHLDWDKTKAAIDAQRGGFQLNTYETTLESTAGNFDIKEQTSAAYLMAHFEWGRFEWLGGFRLENTTYRYAADQAVIDTTITSIPLGRKFNGHYTYLLPTVSAKYKSKNGLLWRAVAGASYARPGFDLIAPFDLFNQLDGVVLAGNPDLKPTYAWNADLTLEKTLPHGGSITLAMFGKHLQNFIYTTQSTESRLYNGNPVNVLTTRPLNGESAWLAGLELGWQQRLAQLPGAWSGLGIYANYTYTWSRATAEEEGETEEEEEGFQLPGQSPHSGNLAIWYDYKRWSGRAALNVQGDFLLQAAEPEDAALQLIYGGSAQLDLNLGYRINRYWQLFAEGMNLLNTPLRYFTGDKNHPSKLERYGAWGRIGVKVKV